MKKIFISVLLVVFVIVSCACAVFKLTDNRNTEDTKDEEIGLPNYVFYFASSGSAVAYSGESSMEVPSGNVETKNFSFPGKSITNRPADASDQITLKINEDSYVLEYGGTYETALSDSENYKSYSVYNLYKRDWFRAYTRAVTNELLFFSNTSDARLEANCGITEAEAKDIAETTIISLYGQNILKEYTFEETIYTNTDNMVQYTVIYRKYVWGTPTDDSIQISINMSGKVVAINAKNLGLFSNAEKLLTKDSIDNAVDKMRETFSNKWTIGKTMLVLDSEGDYYISAHLFRDDSEGTKTMVVYVNLNLYRSIKSK